MEEKKEISENNISSIDEDVKTTKKKSKLKTIFKIIGFPIYLPYIILKNLIKVIFKLILLPIKLICFSLKIIFKIFKNIFKFIMEHKKGTVIWLSVLIIFGVVGYNLYRFTQNYNKILVTNKELIQTSENIYMLDEELLKLSARINTFSLVEKTRIHIYTGKLTLADSTFLKKKSWNVDLNSLVEGMNTVEITVLFKDGNEMNKTIEIYNKSPENIRGLDSNDSDGDGLKNYREDIIGTNKNNKDTDDDGISDYDEIYYSFTDPTKKDTDVNNIEDSKEDYDKDGLTNIEEIIYKTSPTSIDSDGDSISDDDEIKKYKTNPINPDSDGDKIEDNIEIQEGLNPNEINTSVNISKLSEDKEVLVKFNEINGTQLSSVKIEKSRDKIIRTNFEGYIAGPYNFTIDGQISNIQIEFKFDSSKLNSNAKPTIYYYNENDQTIEELDTKIKGNAAYTVVNHFSQYILLDKNIIDAKIANAPKVDGSNVSSSVLYNTEYIILGFPILNFFGVPIYIFKVDDNEENLELIEKTAENYLGGNYDVICSTITKIGAKVLDLVFSWVENTIIQSFGETENKQEYQNFLQYIIFYKRISGAGDLERCLIGEDRGIIKDTAIIDKTTDSNRDGISDYFTKLICEGQLTTKLGTNPFGNSLFSEVQRNNDCDKDKLKNGEEIEIIEENGVYYIVEYSSPILADSDGDGAKDNQDASPLSKFDDRFSVVGSLDYIPVTPTEDKFEEESRKVYNTEKEPFGTSYERANAQVVLFGDMPAALALRHFLNNTGTTYNFNGDWSLLNTYRGKVYLARNTNTMMSVIEETVKNNQTLYFATNTEATATDFGSYVQDISDIGWWYAVGHTRATMVAKATKTNDTSYKMTLYYNVEDFYDWNKDSNFIDGFGGLVYDAEMYRLHTYGVAQQYRIHIPYKMEITWNKGDRYSADYTVPENMEIKKLN